MARYPDWQDEYWLLLLQLYLRKPQGVKPLYSHDLVKVAMELHIPPHLLYQRMFRLRVLDTPSLRRLWDVYAQDPRRLAHDIKRFRRMRGFGHAEMFYQGVEVVDTWERDFKPLKEDQRLTPVKLILILDLYFRLTPITMSPDTPEIVQLAKLINLNPKLVVDVMDTFLACDPCMKSEEKGGPLRQPCEDIWARYGNDEPQNLAALAAQLKEYY